MSSEPLKRIGDYEVVAELGHGGMGKVYKVRNVISDRIEAMKILLPELAERPDLAARFLREIKLVASLDHPNIGALRTALNVEGQLIMIMEFVEGTTLEDKLEPGPLPVGEALEYTHQVLSALSYAHQRGVVHRDIKPANMMLTAGGVIKVMDFGIAFSGTEQKLTSTGTTIGSLPYMSPEQVKGEATDPRSDLYSLGVSLYEMVTGGRPFAADSDFAIMLAHVKDTPRPPIELKPELPEELNTLILRALSKEKEQRFQSADEFRAALKAIGSAKKTAVPAKTAIFTPSAPVPVPVERLEALSPAPAVAAPTAPAARPAPAAQPAPRSRRGLYLALGAVFVVGLLVVLLGLAGVAFFYLRSAPATSQEGQPPPAAASEEQPRAKPAPPPAVEKPPPPAPAADIPKALPPRAAPVQSQAEPVEEAAPAVDRAQLEVLERRIENLTRRAAAVDGNLETLQQQQRAAGYNLRGDVAANWASMKFNLEKAQRALDNTDLDAARKYADLTENYLRQLERFLGR